MYALCFVSVTWGDASVRMDKCPEHPGAKMEGEAMYLDKLPA